MYMVAIAWLYVVILMAITERSFVAGLVTFLFYGLFPLALLLWLVGTPRRRALRERAEAEAAAVGAAAPAAPGQAVSPEAAASVPMRPGADTADHRDPKRDQ